VTVVNGKTRTVEAQTVNTSNLSVAVTDEFFSYSPRGELTDVYESTPHSGGYYHTTTSYWPTGALKALNGIPGVPTIYYGGSTGAGLDAEGRIVYSQSGMPYLKRYLDESKGVPLQDIWNDIKMLRGIHSNTAVGGGVCCRLRLPIKTN